MLALAFLNPMLLWALPLAAVPIIIHILNRRRFKKVPWAAMDFLLRAMKRNRKRLRLEQWLVLLLRVLAVLFLGLLVARPQLGGGLIGSRTHHVVVLDDSASMMQAAGSTSLFERAQDRTRALADHLAKTRSGDLFSVVRTSRAGSPELWGLRVGADLGKRIGRTIEAWTPTAGGADLGRSLQAVRDRAGSVEEASRTHYYLVGDQRAWDFVTEADKPRPAVQAALAAMIPDREHLTLLGVSGSDQNLGVVAVRLADRLAVADVPAKFAIDVQNFGLDAAAPTALSVEIDGKSRVSLQVPKLAPGELVTLPLSHTFGGAGYHRIEARLDPADRFAVDDRHTLVLEVRQTSRVLLVDGDPDSEYGETAYLQVALDPTEDGRFGVDPEVVSDEGADEVDLDPYDFVWLCNVQAPTSALVGRLEAFVGAGGGLGIFSGPLLEVDRYNELMWRDGGGLLPLPLGEIGGDPDRPEAAVMMAPDHPMCGAIGPIYELVFGNRIVQIFRWLTLVDDFEHDAAVIARIRDSEGPPLIAVRPFGEHGGQVALFAITADRRWSTFPVTDLFLPAMQELHRFAARPLDTVGDNLTPDGTWRIELDPGVYRPDVTLVALADEGDERTFTATEAGQGEGGGGEVSAAEPPALEVVVPMTELRELGTYAVRLARYDGASEERFLARNPAPDESHLVGWSESAFRRTYPEELQDHVTFVTGDSDFGSGAGGGEVWRLLAACLVAGLLLESLLAWRFGRR